MSTFNFTLVPDSDGIPESIDLLSDEHLVEQCAYDTDLVLALLGAKDDPSPGVDMWRGHATSAVIHGLHVHQEAMARGADVEGTWRLMVGMQYLTGHTGSSAEMPDWWGGPVHRYHRSLLNDADPVHYSFPVQGTPYPVIPSTGRTGMPHEASIPVMETDDFCCCKHTALLSKEGPEMEGHPCVENRWWACAECGAPIRAWMEVMKNVLGSHVFDGGPQDQQVLSSDDLFHEITLLNGYELADELSDDGMFSLAQCFSWKYVAP